MTPKQWSDRLYPLYRTSGDGLKTITASLVCGAVAEAKAEERARCAAKARGYDESGSFADICEEIAAAIEGLA